MLRNYLTVAIRHLLRQRLYSTINLVGMAVGMAGCVLIAVLLRAELSFDRNHPNAGRIHRVLRETRLEGSQYFALGTSGALGPALEADFADIEASVRIR